MFKCEINRKNDKNDMFYQNFNMQFKIKGFSDY